MREKILSCLGKFPEKTNLDFRVESTEEKEDYVSKVVSYNVEKGQRVNTVLLEPRNIHEPMPAIVAIHQHAGQWHLGKSEVIGTAGNPMYHYGLKLVKKGYVVIAPDLLCFEERIPPSFTASSEANQNYERFEFCRYVENGSSLQTKYLHDLSVAVDVLESLTYVNKNIGVIGHSLGGQESTWLMWYDQRIKAGVSSCGISTVSSIFENNILHNFALYVPGLTTVCDIDEIVCEIAPRPFIMTNGLHDPIFPLDGVHQIAENAKKAYSNKNAQENFKSIVFDGKHEFRDSEKNIAYEWLDRNLNKC